MIDVVYPLGKATGHWGHDCIRFSIRSLEKHAEDIGWRIFIIGEMPAFLDYRKVTHIPFTETRMKEANIMEKALAAAKDSRVSEEFLFMNDDFFLTRDAKLSEFPIYHKGEMAAAASNRSNSYDQMVQRTATVLRKAGCSTLHYDIHCPHRLKKQWVLDAYDRFRTEIYEKPGMAIRCTVMNHAGAEGEYRKDEKIAKKDIGRLKREHAEMEFFSVFDNAQNDELHSFMEELYPEKSYFEV